MKPLCIYHANCPDGFAAAWIVHNETGAELFPGIYNEPPPLELIAGRPVYIVDFSYPFTETLDVLRCAESTIWLDHHQTAIELSNAHATKLAEAADGGLAQMLDIDYSGAMLTWRWFYGGTEAPPRVIQAVQDRDLWRFDLEGTAEIFGAITSRPYTLEAWDEIMNTPASDLIAEGVAIERFRQRRTVEAVERAREVEIAGFKVLVTNSDYAYASDVAGELAKGRPFGAYYMDTPTHHSFGLRSTDGAEDVAQIAEQFGGGGHKHASGFRWPLDSWPWKGTS